MTAGQRSRPKVVVVTTVPVSVRTFLRGQLKVLGKHHDVILVTSPGESNERIAAEEGVPLVEIPMTRRITPVADLRAVLALTALFRRERPEIVHTHTPKAGLLGMLAARAAGVPNRFHTVHGLRHLGADGWQRRMLLATEWMTYACATRLFVAAGSLRPQLPSQRGRAMAEMIAHGSANGIDCERFAPGAIDPRTVAGVRRELEIPDGATVLAFVGRVVGDKGVAELLDAFAALAAERPVVLVVVGAEEPDLDPLPVRTRGLLHSHPRIRRCGWVDDVRPYLAVADALVLPSYREAVSTVLLEAGAMGVPVVATAIPGVLDLVIDGESGLLVPPRDTAALEAALRRIVSEPELRSGLADRAREIVRARFDREQFRAALLAAYRVQTAI